ncbi:LOW QUALITY PROTEIN: hypothetical protein RJ639_025097 [Escallonia herrerae]|uniref:Uncharacterized protein n=1 Tax=Escallonia herrerae TaxID=1293975 RepID=A0AA89ACS8_9ASTE|nr:LOW QUALITY PROTEIN: hypothetical protein RJ639_025097 [Escallonia herrerae]
MDTAGFRATAYLSAVLLLCNFNGLNYCTAISNVTRAQNVSVGETLTSPGQVFDMSEFGTRTFLCAKQSGLQIGRSHLQLQILSAMIGSDGNLVILDGTSISIWSTNLSVGASEAVAVLSDNGELVLKDGTSGEILWESFQFPGDTFLPGMKLGMNTITGERRFLSSWQTEDNPLPGFFSVGIVPESPAQAFVWKGSTPYWRTGPWNGVKFFGLPNTAAANLNGFSFLIEKNQGSAYFSITISSSSLVRIVVISPVGTLKVLDWDEGTKKWNQWWQEPEGPCDVYGTCGAFGVCNQSRSPICRCMKGFVPKSNEEWRRGNWKGGCVRRTQLQCEKNESHTSLESGKDDGFWQLSGLKLPDFPIYLNLDDAAGCGIWCLNNCSCVAYASIEQINCIVWIGDLLDVQESLLISAESLFLRLAKSELGNKFSFKALGIHDSFPDLYLVLKLFSSSSPRCRANHRGKWKPRIWNFSVVNLINNSRDSPQRSLNINMSRQDSSELHMFEFYKIAAATHNFSIQNKVGEGGFGPVFKRLGYYYVLATLCLLD